MTLGDLDIGDTFFLKLNGKMQKLTVTKKDGRYVFIKGKEEYSASKSLELKEDKGLIIGKDISE